MNGLGEIQINNAGAPGSFYTVRHNTGIWIPAITTQIEYKMSGFNPLTGQSEFWSALNPRQGPPSGASLLNINIAAIITNFLPPTK